MPKCASCFTVMPAMQCLWTSTRIKAPRTKRNPIGFCYSSSFVLCIFCAPHGSQAYLAVRVVIGVSAGLTAVLALCLPGRLRSQLAPFAGPNLDSVKWELNLIKHTTGKLALAQLHGYAEDALKLKARFEKLPGVRVVEIASLLPTSKSASWSCCVKSSSGSNDFRNETRSCHMRCRMFATFATR